MNDRTSGADPYASLSNRTSGHRPRTGLYIVGATLAVVAVFALVAVLLTGGDDGEAIESVQETAAVQVSGDPLPPYPADAGLLADPATDPAVGRTPPTLVGEAFDGSPVTIDPGDGRAKLVIFAAHWCPHCQKEIPLIQGWIDDGSLPEDVDVYLVSTAARADQSEYPPSGWLGSIGWSETVLLDNADQSAANAYGLTGYPYLVFVDADGTVVQRASGELPIPDVDRLVGSIAA
jgi:thiol-disulfide isomerase/thioredoxin